MKKIYLFYFLMISINLLPFISMSNKGIIGLFFIVFSSIKYGLKSGLHTAILLILLEVLYFTLGINVDYSNGVASMFMGSLIYLVIAVYLGKFTDTLKNKNHELQNEIKKRQNIEKELVEKIALLQNLMDTLPSPIAVKDLEFRFTGCNNAFIRDFKISKKDLIGQSVYDFFNINEAETHNKMDIEILKKQGTQVYETTLTFGDGSLRNIVINKTLLTDVVGSPNGIVGVITDITAQKESERLKKSFEKDKRNMDEMLEYDRMKTEFFSNISHELRTPINILLGATQLMEMYSQDNQYIISQGKVIKNVKSMKLNCLRLLRLVNNLIDITRIDVNAFKLNLKNLDIVYIVEEVTLSVSDYVKNKEINLLFDTDIEEKIMVCDEEHIERIMLNLLSNAIKFTKNKGSIFVNIFDKENGVCIQVRDTGIGIPLDRQQDIFRRFCQIRPLFTKPQEGSGIGLSLVKSLVELQGGNITVESEIDRGTTFSIFLPNRLLKEDELQGKEIVGKQDGGEKIQVEFSDIYYATEQ